MFQTSSTSYCTARTALHSLISILTRRKPWFYPGIKSILRQKYLIAMFRRLFNYFSAIKQQRSTHNFYEPLYPVFGFETDRLTFERVVRVTWCRITWNNRLQLFVNITLIAINETWHSITDHSPKWHQMTFCYGNTQWRTPDFTSG